MRTAATVLLLTALAAPTASAQGLDEAKNNFHRWLGCGYSEGYHAPKCCRPGGLCAQGSCEPYTARYPRNPSRYTGRVNYPGACGCGAYGAYGAHAWSPQEWSASGKPARGEAIETGEPSAAGEATSPFDNP